MKKIASDMVIRPLRRITFFLLLLSAVPALAQTYYFDSYGVVEGLAQSKVSSIIQDQDDYLWLGTRGGVSRFDGITFENYSSLDGMATQGVQTLMMYGDGSIWCGHLGGGISRYKNKKFEVVTGLKKYISSNSDVTGIIQGKSKEVWIATFGSGVLRIKNPDAGKDALSVKQYKGKSISDRVFFAFVNKDSDVFFITDLGIKKFVSEKDSFENYQPNGLDRYFSFTCMTQDVNGNIWFGTDHGGLHRLDSKTGAIRSYDIRDGLSSNWISTLYGDSRGYMWVGTWGGGITRIKDTVRVFNSDNGLPDDKISSISEDEEGNILIGTYEHGLAIYKGDYYSISTRDGLNNSVVYTIAKDKRKRLWFGTNEGINIYDPSVTGKKAFSTLINNTGINQIHHLVADQTGNMWIGTPDGIWMYSQATSRFEYPMVNLYLPNIKKITALAVDQKNNIWGGSTDGLIYFNPATQDTRRITNINGLAGNEISVIYVDKANTLRVGAVGKGITLIKDTAFSKIDIGEGVTPLCIQEDLDGEVWVGTQGNGVLVMKDNRIVRRYSVKEGLLANLINLINVDQENNIYIGTNKGLNKIFQGSNSIYTYTEKNGFTGIETKSNASLLDDHFIWFGTGKGVNFFDPHQHQLRHDEPQLHIQKFMVGYEEKSLSSVMKLSHKENYITISYYSISLTNPGAVKYQVMLEGADNEWQPVTTQNSVRYSALQPGRYVFRVKAQNSFGIWNKEPLSFEFRIAPPFWRTWWFIALCVILGAVSIYLYIHVRERNLIREKHILEEKVQERTLEIAQKNELLAEKNKDITDSIRYAKRIQTAVFPMNIPFAETFIVFRPKDIVSGDFFWMLQAENKDFIAAVDCTGHGVPGAFMSLIGHNLLTKIVREYKIYKPSDILYRLNEELNRTLQQHGDETVKDGMDMALICFDPKTGTLEMAGAYNPMYHISNGTLNEVKADRMAIGRNTGPDKIFTNHSIQISKGDAVYMLSDGSEDQFGGPAGKKFKAAQMKELLVSIQSNDMTTQKNIIEKKFEDWKGDTEQIDDVLVIGRRF